MNREIGARVWVKTKKNSDWRLGYIIGIPIKPHIQEYDYIVQFESRKGNWGIRPVKEMHVKTRVPADYETFLLDCYNCGQEIILKDEDELDGFKVIRDEGSLTTGVISCENCGNTVRISLH